MLETAKTSVVKSILPLSCEKPGDLFAVLVSAGEEGQKISECLLEVYIQTLPGCQNIPTDINSCQWVTG